MSCWNKVLDVTAMFPQSFIFIFFFQNIIYITSLNPFKSNFIQPSHDYPCVMMSYSLNIHLSSNYVPINVLGVMDTKTYRRVLILRSLQSGETVIE